MDGIVSAPPNPPEPAAIGEPVLDLPAGRRHLASAHARRQARQVWGAIGGGIGFAAAYAVGLALEAQGWSTPLFPATV